MRRLRYRVLDAVIEIEAEKDRWLGEVRKSLARFPKAVDNEKAMVAIRADAEAIAAFDAQGALLWRRDLEAGDPLPWLLKTMTNQCLLTALTATHDILHGSAVADGERAYLFIGGSGSGKTTLILALRRRGYRLLCEGQIPVSRATSLIQPFPRGVEEKTAGDFPPSSFKKTAPLGGRTHPRPCPAAGIFFSGRYLSRRDRPGVSRRLSDAGTGRVAANPFRFAGQRGARRGRSRPRIGALYLSTHRRPRIERSAPPVDRIRGAGGLHPFGEAESAAMVRAGGPGGNRPSASGARPGRQLLSPGAERGSNEQR